MKRLFVLFSAIVAVVISVNAQNTVTGKVIDNEERQPVIQATVSLLKTDSTLIGNSVTNVNGIFNLSE